MKVIKIGAVWCNGCLVMKPRWQEIETELPWLTTEYFDYDQGRTAIEKYKIDSDRLPVFIFIDKTDRELIRLNGEISKDKLISIINEYKDK